MRAKARRLHSKEENGLGLIIVDYMQLMTSGKRVESRQVEVSEFSRSLKLLAKELEVPVVAISQLNRGPEQRTDKRPQLSDLRESGAIEQDADVVMFIYRDEYYQERSEPKRRPEESEERHQERYENWRKRYEDSLRKADVIIAKQRNGPTGTIKLAFLREQTRFADLVHGGGSD